MKSIVFVIYNYTVAVQNSQLRCSAVHWIVNTLVPEYVARIREGQKKMADFDRRLSSAETEHLNSAHVERPHSDPSRYLLVDTHQQFLARRLQLGRQDPLFRSMSLNSSGKSIRPPRVGLWIEDRAPGTQ